jgi:RHS repeat-associated protein
VPRGYCRPSTGRGRLRRRRGPKSQHPRFCSATTGRRYYNPSTGRWLSRDPIGEKGGLNLYAFVRNDPIGKTDSLGQDLWIINYPDFPWHQGVIGQRQDGKYWYIDFGPACHSWVLCAPGKVDYTNPTPFDPNKLTDGLTVADHIKTSKEVDQKLEAYAEEQSHTRPYYSALKDNCRNFANDFRVKAWVSMQHPEVP